MSIYYRIMVYLLSLTIAVGCEGRRQVEPTTFSPVETKRVLAIVLDLSGSFADKMATDGLGYKFALAVIDKYMRENIGEEDARLIIAQISGDGRHCLLWEGQPHELRRNFSAQEFRKFLLANSDAGASPVHHGLAVTLDYLLHHRSLQAGATPAVFVLSDMLDNASQPEDEQAVTQALAEFGQRNGVVGMYYVSQSELARWSTVLANSNLKDYRIECEIVHQPTLPSFE